MSMYCHCEGRFNGGAGASLTIVVTSRKAWFFLGATERSMWNTRAQSKMQVMMATGWVRVGVRLACTSSAAPICAGGFDANDASWWMYGR